MAGLSASAPPQRTRHCRAEAHLGAGRDRADETAPAVCLPVPGELRHGLAAGLPVLAESAR